MSEKKEMVKTAKVDYAKQVLLLDGEDLPFYIGEDVYVHSSNGITSITVEILVDGDVEVIQRG